MWGIMAKTLIYDIETAPIIATDKKKVLAGQKSFKMQYQCQSCGGYMTGTKLHKVVA